jgi:ABC-type Mn2+/Zn2+ transport system permease subunit
VLDELVEPFALPFMQRALLEVCLLSVIGGLLGSWIVLRRLAFYTHAVGSATFPGLVVAGPWGLPPKLAGLGASLLMAAGLERLTRGRRVAPDAGTGMLLVAALAIGVVLASDVYGSGAGVDRLLFGSLLAISVDDLVVAAVAAGAVLALDAAMVRPWLASAFDPSTARSLGVPARAGDWALLALVAAAVVVSVDAAGALLVGALFVLPAATVLLVAPSVRALRVGAVALTLVEGVVALWLAYRLDVPPGPALALLGGLVFAAVALAAASVRARTRGARAVAAR